MNGLMLAFAFSLPYHVLRTAAAAGVRVHVLGSGPSRGLRASRHCASYTKSRLDPGGELDPETILDEIERVARRRRIDLVFPSDDVSTRLLAAIRERLPVRSTPLPDLATFDLLNDKWNFTQFAQDHGVRVPQGRLYRSAEAVRRDLASGALALPVTVKPTNFSGSRGVMHIREPGETALLDTVDYAPVLVQRHIVGRTVGISVIARGGRILAHAAQYRDDRNFRLFSSPDLLRNVEIALAACRFDGPANFDAVIEDASGLAYLVECNPRFWYTIYMSMLVGLNFFGAAVGDDCAAPATLDRGSINLSPKATLSRPWQSRAADWRLLAYDLADPLVYALRRSRLAEDGHIAVRASQMSPYLRREMVA